MPYLVIDCGTSGCRALLVSGSGEIVRQRRLATPPSELPPFLGETEAEGVWNQVKQVTSSILEGLSANAIEAVGVSSMLGYVFLDESNRPLMPATLWADNRAWKEAKELKGLFGDDELYRRTGRRTSPELLAAKILWLRRHEPEAFRRIRTVLGLKDEIVRRLTGKCVTDYAHQDYTSLWDVRSGQPLREIMAILGIAPDLFPEAAPAYAVAGPVTSRAARETGLANETPVIVGTSDGTAAMYGGGILQEGKAVLVSGTTDVLMMRSDGYVEDESRVLTVNRGMISGTFLVGGAMGLSAGAVCRLEYLLHRSATEMEPLVVAAGPGAGGLLFFPGLTGERAPHWREHFTGGILGLRISHGPEHIFRALMEGSALRVKGLLDRLKGNGLEPHCIHVVGGGAALDVWNQIRADATAKEIRCPEASEATALGTAMFCRAAAKGANVLTDLASEWVRVKRCYEPMREHTVIYERLAELYSDFLEAADPVYQGLRAWGAPETDSASPGALDEGRAR